MAHCRSEPVSEFVIATELGIIHRMRKECPDKEFICAPTFDLMQTPADNCRCSQCKFMKSNTLTKVWDCMKDLNPRIELPKPSWIGRGCPSNECLGFPLDGRRANWAGDWSFILKMT